MDGVVDLGLTFPDGGGAAGTEADTEADVAS